MNSSKIEKARWQGVRSRVLLMVVLVVAGLSGCEGSRDGGKAASVAPAPFTPRIVRQSDGSESMPLRPADVPGLTVVTASAVELPAVLETTGQVTFDDRRVSSIISRVNGRVEDTRVSQWDEVHKGQPIVQLYSPDLMTAEAEYLEASSSRLITNNSSSNENSKFARALISSARRKLELLGLESADIKTITAPSPTIVMRAPITGTVVEKKVVRGQQVSPGDVLFSLGTLEDIWITGDIYESDVARVHEGQQLEAVVTAFPDETFIGRIARVSPNVDPNTHIIQIRCEVDNPDLKLKPQMLARVRIVTQPGSALVVPQDALVFDTDSYYAYVMTGEDFVARRKVGVTSWNERGYARVLSGLQQGDRVIKDESIQVNALWHQAHGETS